MANTAQARKRARQALNRRAHNRSLRSRLRTAIKSVRQALSAGDKQQALAAFQSSQGVIDSMAGKGIIHKNAAARYKSRLMARIKALG
ncbi:MAG: 30S ribosomal protein S20 [Tepidiphilus sp.]|jgi:small subunit ribosomal protein S20|nr:30S ribosomal protein S20 [Tepidiphilus sp.]MDD3432365.1 30S ribosomal protein S20 [Tepidiphilus sp.]